jgi:branched-chain amino acid transport system substrate-binding protein
VGWRIPTVVHAMKRVTGSGIVGGRHRRLEGTTLRKYRLLLFVPMLAFVMQACGTRLPNSAFVNANQNTQGAQGISQGDQTATDNSGTGGTAGDQGTAGSVTGGGTTGGSGATAGKSGAAAGGSGGGAGGPNTASDVGVTPTSIKIGNITSIQGQFGPDAFSPSLYGLQAWAAGINAKGGINGRKVTIDTCDDRDTGDGNLACAQKLVDQDKVFAFLANNSQSSSRAASFTASKGVPDLGLPLNNGYQKYPTMFDFYGNNGAVRDGKQVGVNGKRWQTTGIYRWFKQQRGINNAAVFFFNIAVSAQQGYAFEANLSAEGIQTVYEGGGSHSGENFAAPTFDTDVVNMKQKNVQGIWDAMDVGSNQKLCNAMDRGNFKVTAKVSTIEAWSQAVGTDFSSPCRNSVYSEGSTAPYSDKSNPVVQQFLADMSKYQPGRKLHQWQAEGWGMGLEFQHAAEQMGPNLTRKGFIDWLDNLSSYTLDGFERPHDYKPKDFNAPFHDCFSIVHWQDSAQTFATEAPITTCLDAKWVGSDATDDGS